MGMIPMGAGGIIDIEAARAAAQKMAYSLMAAHKGLNPDAEQDTAAAASQVPGKSTISFVIPKNKLSGALVPIAGQGVKWQSVDPKSDEPPRPPRNTKWGPDPLQDEAVKKSRALALQVQLLWLLAIYVVDSARLKQEDSLTSALYQL